MKFYISLIAIAIYIAGCKEKAINVFNEINYDSLHLQPIYIKQSDYQKIDIDSFVSFISPFAFYGNERSTFAVPNNMFSNNDNEVVICDRELKRIIIFEENGELKKIIQIRKDALSFAYDYSRDNILVVYDDEIFIYNRGGELVKKAQNPCKAVIINPLSMNKFVLYNSYSLLDNESERGHNIYFCDSNLALTNYCGLPFGKDIKDLEIPYSMNFVYSYNGNTNIINSYEKKVYSIDTSGSIHLKYIINDNEPLSRKTLLRTFYEFKSMIFISKTDSGRLSYCFVNKSDSIRYSANKPFWANIVWLDKLSIPFELSVFNSPVQESDLYTFITKEKVIEIIKKYQEGKIAKDSFYYKLIKIDLNRTINNILVKIKFKDV